MKFTETDRSLFEQAVNTLSKKGCYIPTCEIVEILQIYDIISNRKDISRAEGASKYVIVFSNKEYVLKWSEDDSVLMESVIYDRAVDKGISFLFPETIFLGEFNSIYYSIQQKIDYSAANIPAKDRSKYAKMAKTVTEDIFRKMENGFQVPNCHYNRDLHRTWAKVFISLYGKAIAKKLCTFIQENRINDLHASNIGFCNYKPILLDFCGYENDLISSEYY
jgi:hypothetical protein